MTCTSKKRAAKTRIESSDSRRIKHRIDKSIPPKPEITNGLNLITSPVIAVPALISKTTKNSTGKLCITAAAIEGINA
ncbi:MAG: hypothetical protein VB075_11365, partial [Petrimonas sp.]|uniref:hypothetical protein n=1 Tax=Petrimonas sp. TaxID=2023866 RepID=UPI002B398C2B|nr:hypothetical protein [Petrimonas sp.]